MTSLPVVIGSRALGEIDAAFAWWARHRSAEQATRWQLGIEAAIMSLGNDPKRYSIAPENSDYPVELRQMHFGLGRRASHRVIFTIRPDSVYVLSVRHVSQAPLGPDDLP